MQRDCMHLQRQCTYYTTAGPAGCKSKAVMLELVYKAQGLDIVSPNSSFPNSAATHRATTPGCPAAPCEGHRLGWLQQVHADRNNAGCDLTVRDLCSTTVRNCRWFGLLLMKARPNIQAGTPETECSKAWLIVDGRSTACVARVEPLKQ